MTDTTCRKSAALDKILAAHNDLAHAEQLAQQAKDARRKAIQEANGILNDREIARALHLSPARVYNIRTGH